MKKIFKGCLFIAVGLVLILAISISGYYVYSKIPNSVIVLEKPSNLQNLLPEEFAIVKNLGHQKTENIVYQAFIEKNIGGISESVLIILIRTKKDMSLVRNFPIKPNDSYEINKILTWRNLKSDFQTYLKLPSNMLTESNVHISVYNPTSKVKLNLRKGSYQFKKINENHGYTSEVAFYDKSSNLFYFEKRKFHSFQ